MKTAAKTCPVCEDTGWKTVTTAAGERVTRCDCKLGERSRRLLANAHIPARYEHCDISEFVTLNPSLAAARLAAEKFVQEYPLEQTGLLLVGTVGVGKTHLGVGIMKGLLEKGIPSLFCDYRELLKQIQNSYNPSVNTTEMELLRPVFETEVLVLDELGAIKPTEWVWDTVSLVLNTRYNEKRTTIITTNFADQPAGALAGQSSSASAASRATRDETLGDRIGERMRSRLHEMCRKIEMQGDDFRQRVRSASFR